MHTSVELLGKFSADRPVVSKIMFKSPYLSFPFFAILDFPLCSQSQVSVLPSILLHIKSF